MHTLSQSLMADQLKYADYQLGFIQLLPLVLGREGCFPEENQMLLPEEWGELAGETNAHALLCHSFTHPV